MDDKSSLSIPRKWQLQARAGDDPAADVQRVVSLTHNDVQWLRLGDFAKS